MSANSIKPCQCGSSDHCIGNIDEGDSLVQVICEDCRMAGPQEKNEEAAIEAWNRIVLAGLIVEQTALVHELLEARGYFYDIYVEGFTNHKICFLTARRAIDDIDGVLDLAQDEQRRMLKEWDK